MISTKDFKVGDVCSYFYIDDEREYHCICIVNRVKMNSKKKPEINFTDLKTGEGLLADTDYNLNFPLPKEEFRDFKILYNALDTAKELNPEYFLWV